MAHGVHPNFTEKHEEHHRPELQKGLVIKHNANQRYATSGVTSFLFKEVARLSNLPTQVKSVNLSRRKFLIWFIFIYLFFFILDKRTFSEDPLIVVHFSQSQMYEVLMSIYVHLMQS